MTIQYQLKMKLMAFAMATVLIGCSSQSAKQEQQVEDTPAQQGQVDENVNKLENYKMELDQNKKLVAEFIEAMRISNVDKLKTMITDDFSWWIIGKPEYLATAGEHDTEYFLNFFKGEELFPEGTDFRTVSMISEGNTVAAEAEFSAKTAMGTDYENYYHFLFIIEDGKIKRMKEYMDTYHAKVTFGL